MSPLELSQIPRSDRPVPRWRIVRTVGMLQVKLILGNVHNFALMPVCLLAGAVDILFKNRRDEALLYKVLAWGRHLDEMIGLYRPLENAEGAAFNPPERYSVDALVDRLEAAVRNDYANGGTTASAKRAMDHALTQIRAEAAKHGTHAKEAIERAAAKVRTRMGRHNSGH